jgi:hypothetical protein
MQMLNILFLLDKKIVARNIQKHTWKGRENFMVLVVETHLPTY